MNKFKSSILGKLCLKSNWRKNKMSKKGQYIISSFIKNTKAAEDIKLIIDIDPVDII